MIPGISVNCITRAVTAALACLALALAVAPAADATPAAPAAHSTNCNVNTAYCNFLANYTADWWAYGTQLSQPIISNSSSDQWWAGHQEATGWYLLENKNGDCLNVVSATDISTDSCQASDTREWFHFQSGPSGSDLISNYWDGLGQYFWIDNASGAAISLVGGGALPGSELYMRA
jgi:hypothetical protein